jgi:hypothetical protein
MGAKWPVDSKNLILPGALLALISLTGSLAWSGTVGIPIKDEGIPAIDLNYQGSPIDRDEAIDLSQRGVDLSNLDPSTSDAWKPESLPLSNAEKWNYPKAGATVKFVRDLGALPGMYRASVLAGEGSNQLPFQLLVSTNAHTALTTAALLRKLGYPIASPQWYPNLSISFSSVADLKLFVDDTVRRLQKSQQNLFVQVDEEAKRIDLKDVVLEPAQIDTWMFHWGLNKPSLINGRRSLRALIMPVSWFDIPETINYMPWEFTKIQNNYLVLSHSSAENYREATFSDLKWMARKIVKLSREDISEILSYGKFPTEVQVLLTEKLIARQKQLAEVLGLKDSGQRFDYNRQINYGRVVRGKLTADCTDDSKPCYPGYIALFNWKDPESPLKTDDILRYLEIQGMGTVISKLTDEMNKYLEFKKTNSNFTGALDANCPPPAPGTPPDSNCIVPVGTYGGFQAGLRLQVGRDLITGNYYGGESKVQLVDSIGVTASVGVQTGRAGISAPSVPMPGPSGTVYNAPSAYGVTFGLGANVAVSRNYVHVRPVTSTKAALKQNWGQLYVPDFMNRLSKTLDLEASGKCVFDYPKPRDPNEPTPQPSASPSPGSSPTPNPTPTLEPCPDSFFSDLKEGELFIVTDSINGGVNANARIPLANILDLTFMGATPSLSMSAGAQHAILRRTTITRTKDGVEVYLQRVKTGALSFELSADFWINILRYSTTQKNSTAQSKVFKFPNPKKPAEDASDAIKTEAIDQRRKVAVALEVLLRSNNSSVVETDFPYYALNHDLSASIQKGNFLRWHWFGMDEKHTARIRPPKDPANPAMNPADHERVLFSHRMVRTNGSNDQAFVSDIIKAWTKGIEFMGGTSGNNPGNSFLGRGQYATWMTEAEITPGKESSPVTTIEHHWNGWKLPKKNVLGILDGIEARVKPLNLDQPIMRRDVFIDMGELQFYEIVSKLIIYESGMNKIRAALLDPTLSLDQLHDKMTSLVRDPKKFSSWCWQQGAPSNHGNRSAFFPRPDSFSSGIGFSGSNTPDPKRPETWGAYWGDVDWSGDARMWYCATDWMKEVFKARKAMPKDSKERIIFVNRLIRSLETSSGAGAIPMEKLLGLLSKEDWFFQVRVSGFRTQDANGDMEYTSDSLGSLSEKDGAGIFSEFSSRYGISSHELQARYLSEGY